MNSRLTPPMTDERAESLDDDLQLCEAVAERNPAAMEEFYARYHRLAEFMARKAMRVSGVTDDDDLAQEALIQMYESANAYRPVVNQARFSRYATSYLLPKLRRVDGMNQIVGLTGETVRMLSNIETLNIHRHNNGLAPMTDEEISVELDIPIRGANTMSVQSLRQAMMLTRYMGSIDGGFSPRQPESPGNDYMLDGMVAMESVTRGPEVTTEEQVEAIFRAEAVAEVLDTLSEREVDIIKMVHGFDGGEDKSLAEVARTLGISRTRVGTIYQRALTKLRDPARRDYLKEFAE